MQSKNLHVHYSFISILYLCPILYSKHGRESASVTKHRGGKKEKKKEGGRERERVAGGGGEGGERETEETERETEKKGWKREEINKLAERLYVYTGAWKGNKNCCARALLQVRAT